MIIACEYCGKLYKTYYASRSVHHYCSKVCAGKAHRTLEEYKCDHCGKSILKQHNVAIKHKHHFCSQDCLNLWQKRNKVEFICKICGKPFYRSPSWTKQRMGYYCSIECRNRDPDWKLRACIQANKVQCQKRGLNKLELAGSEILNNLNISHITQYLVNDKFLVDVYVPEYNLIIQWDGDYWHGKNKSYEDLDYRVKRRVDLDKSQDAYFKKCGFNELRFWESDVYKRKEYVYDTIARTIREIAE